MVRFMLKTLGLPEELVGRPNAIRFGPFVFNADAIVLTSAAAKTQINSAAGTIDKKLTTLDSDRKYWLLLSGYRQFWSTNPDETASNMARLFQRPYIQMERNDTFTFEQLAWASNSQTYGAATTIAAQTSLKPPDMPAYMFKWWWVIDGESDRLDIDVDSDVTTGFGSGVDSNTWMYGFAIRKSVMETFPEPQCGPGALAKLAEQGPSSLSSVAAILGVS